MLLALVSALLLASPFAGAEARPDWNFRVLTTQHFEIIFHDTQRELAKRYALAAEQAYELLIPIFKEGPALTTIYINDDTDNSNGMASFLPYPMITVYPVLPATLDSIDDYGDWPLEMIVHEYTHILNMYPAHGFYVPFKYLFGSVIRPNAVLPKWYLEGLAVDLESHLTDHGRLRAPETMAAARALSIGGRLHLEDIAKINEQELGTWPYGNRPYIFGGWWWSQVQKDKGTAVIETWNQNFSRRIPFLLNGPMREQTGKKAVELLDETADALKTEADHELQVIGGSNPQIASPLLAEKGEQRIFALSPSGGKLIYLLSHPHLPGSPIRGTDVKIKIREFPTQPFQEVAGKRLFKSVGTSRFRWIGESQLVFDQVDIRDPYVAYRDLYLFNLDSGQTKRLTFGMRAAEPSPSPRGDKIAFIKNDGGRNHLMLLTLENGEVKKAPTALAHSSFQQRLSGPEFINNDEIVFAMRVRSGQEKLYVYSFAKHRIQLWNGKLRSAQNPRMTSKGLLVSDDASNARNIYLADPGDSPVKAVTNTLTHIESADFDPQRNEILVSELTPEGNRLKSLPFTTFVPAPITLPSLGAAPEAQTKKIRITESDYQPLPYLLPRYWIPFVYTVENGLLFQGSTGNSDPVGRNLYSLVGSYDTVTKKPAYGASFTNRSLPVNIGVDYAKTVAYLAASNRIVEGQGAGLRLSDPSWPFNSSFVNWSLGGLWNETTGGTLTYRRLGPSAGVSYNRMQSPLNTWGGFLAEVYHNEYLPEKDYVDYGRTYVHTAVTFPIFGASKIFAQARASFAPKLPFNDILDLGERSLGGNYMVNLTNSDFLMRGYPSGQFIGRKALNANFEYSLPVMELAKGAGTFPLFFRALEATVFADAMSVDGAAYRSDKNGYFRSSLNRYFMGTGAELRLSTTAGYHLPVSFVLGAYYGLNQQYGGGFSPFVGLSFGDLGALQDKTP